MSGRKSWLNPGDLLKPGRLAALFPRWVSEDDKTSVLPATPADAKTPALGRIGQGVHADPDPDTVAADDAARGGSTFKAAVHEPHVAQWTPMPKKSEVAHDEPSLASRTRPDLPSPADRHKAFHDAYHDRNATNKSLRQHQKGSLNVVFHGQMNSGHQYIAKPHEGIGHRDLDTMPPETLRGLKDDALAAGTRHDATYELMSAMGAHHMVVPGVTTNMHGRHQFKGPDPDADDDMKKRMTMAAHHAGGLAHVQEFVPGAVNVHHASPEQLDKVDAEHRLHGMVSHLLFGAQDGHSSNVMIHPEGHPVMIDHDMTLATPQADVNKAVFGKEMIRSVFTPGSKLDYQAKLSKDSSGQVIPVGNNFPPRMRETLQRVAEGYYGKGDGTLGLSDKDHTALQKNARELLLYGVEDTLARRHDIDADMRAKKAAKEALNSQVDGVSS
jgi:hypothetical protein